MNELRNGRAVGAVVASMLALLGCGGGMAEGAGSSSGGEGGPITVQNQTQYPICTIEVWKNGGDVHYQVADLSTSPLATGASTTIEVDGVANGLRVIECGDENILWDSRDPRDPRQMEQIAPNGRPFVLAEPGSAVDGNLLALERTPVSNYGSEAGSLQGEFGDAAFSVAQAYASEHRYAETPVGLTVTASDWEINTNRNTGAMVYRWFLADMGARWPDGHCTIEAMGFIQDHDGSDFSGSLRTQGVNAQTQRQVPCAVLASLQSH